MIKFGNTFVKYNETYITDYVLNLPLNTIRVKFSSGYTPIMGDTQTIIDAEKNIWDIYKQSNDWRSLFIYNDKLLEVLGANTTNVTNMNAMFNECANLSKVHLFDTSNVTDMGFMFSHCRSLSSAPLFDTSNVTNMEAMFNECLQLNSVPYLNTSNVTDTGWMFYFCSALNAVPLFDTSNVTSMRQMFTNCRSLTSIPLFDTSKAISANAMFYTCYKVQSGALALYQQMSTQATPPTMYSLCFRDCGRDTQTGSAELAQIPDAWK